MNINVVGFENKTFDYDKMKESVVLIGTKYYLRTDPSLVRVRKNGKLRFFRKDSPLLFTSKDGTSHLKEDGVCTEDGVWLLKSSEDVIEIDKKYYRKQYCTKVDNRYYLLTDPRLVKNHAVTVGLTTRSRYILKESAIELSPKYYGESLYSDNNPSYIITYNNEFYLKSDCTQIWSFIENKPIFVPNKVVRDKDTISLVYEFQDKTNPQENRLVTITAVAKEAINNTMMFSLTGDDGLMAPIVIPNTLKEYFEHARDTYIMPRFTQKCEEWVTKLNKNFDDYDQNENKAKVFKIIPRPFPGKQNIFTPSYYPKPIKSKSFAQTGGLKYSFGVEFETSQGLLTNDACTELDVACVGDRSVGSGEYVTAPLMGDAGLARIEEICKKLNKHTLVDNRCGIHVHVGTLFTPTAKREQPNKFEAPSFNKEFIMNSVNLGAYLEEELYTSMPKTRTPTLYHCHSIKRFAPVTDKNFDVNIGAYIFGPKEVWFAEDKSPIKPFNMSQFALGPNRNSNTSVGTWAEGRYKWLNLIHAYTRSNHRTLEFRIFSGTTVYEKVRAYILTSLAFTYFADNHGQLIKPGITLSQVFETSFANYPDIINELNLFYDARKAKFNRKNIYPKSPYLSFNF